MAPDLPVTSRSVQISALGDVPQTVISEAHLVEISSSVDEVFKFIGETSSNQHTTDNALHNVGNRDSKVQPDLLDNVTGLRKKKFKFVFGKGSKSAEPIMENTVSRSIVVDNNTNIKDKLNDIFPIGPSV